MLVVGSRLVGGLGLAVMLMTACSSPAPETAPTTTAAAATPSSTSAQSTGGSVTTEGPSQDREEATRDGVVAQLAELPVSLRVDPIQSISSDEGLWVLSRPRPETLDLAPGCGLGDPDGVYGRDIICVVEYGEVLLMDRSGTEILRAFPLPGLPPQHLAVADDAVFCGRQGDGGLPDSMLCRIDRTTLQWSVRVFPWVTDSAYGESLAPDSIPDSWIIDDPIGDVLFGRMELTGSGLMVEGQDGQRRVDPSTLELQPASG